LEPRARAVGIVALRFGMLVRAFGHRAHKRREHRRARNARVALLHRAAEQFPLAPATLRGGGIVDVHVAPIAIDDLAALEHAIERRPVARFALAQRALARFDDAEHLVEAVRQPPDLVVAVPARTHGKILARRDVGHGGGEIEQRTRNLPLDGAREQISHQQHERHHDGADAQVVREPLAQHLRRVEIEIQRAEAAIALGHRFETFEMRIAEPIPVGVGLRRKVRGSARLRIVGEERPVLVVDRRRDDAFVGLERGERLLGRSPVFERERRGGVRGDDRAERRDLARRARAQGDQIVCEERSLHEQHHDDAREQYPAHELASHRGVAERHQRRLLLSTSSATRRSFELIVSPAAFAASTLMRKRTWLPSVTKPTMPPRSPKPRVSPTVRMLASLTRSRIASRRADSESLMKSTWQPVLSSALVRRRTTRVRLSTLSPRTVSSRYPSNGSSPRMQIAIGLPASGNERSGQSTNCVKLNRNTAFTWYSCSDAGNAGPPNPKQSSTAKRSHADRRTNLERWSL